MTRPLQARLADWTLACGYSSFVLPLLALLVLAGAGSVSAFWFKCAGLVALAVVSFWMLSQSAKGEIDRPAATWLVSLVYFVTMMASIFMAFQSPTLVVVLCIPEAAGIGLSLVGIIHLLHLRSKNA